MSYATAESYSRVAIWLHWIIAALIIANITIGLLNEDMAREARRFWMGQHFAIGLSVLILSIARVGWRLANPAPPLLRDYAAWERVLARVTHTLFYLLIIGLPLLGWLAISTGRNGGSVDMWGLFSMPGLPVGADESAHKSLEQIHGLLGKVMLGLIVLHILGALKHQFLDRDSTLARMIPLLRAQSG